MNYVESIELQCRYQNYITYIIPYSSLWTYCVLTYISLRVICNIRTQAYHGSVGSEQFQFFFYKFFFFHQILTFTHQTLIFTGNSIFSQILFFSPNYFLCIKFYFLHTKLYFFPPTKSVFLQNISTGNSILYSITCLSPRSKKCTSPMMFS